MENEPKNLRAKVPQSLRLAMVWQSALRPSARRITHQAHLRPVLSIPSVVASRPNSASKCSLCCKGTPVPRLPCQHPVRGHRPCLALGRGPCRGRGRWLV